MNKELQTIYVPTNKEITYDGYLSVRKIFPEGRDKVIEEQVEKQKAIVLSQEEWDKIESQIVFQYEQIERLQQWKQEAIAVMPDFQAIGKALNIKLGESVHDKILPEIERLKKLIHTLWNEQYPNPHLVQDIYEQFKKENNI